MHSFIALLILVSGLPVFALNPTQVENAKRGSVDWGLKNRAPAGAVEAFPSRTSVTSGESVTFYVHSTDGDLVLDVFRMGWYQGAGARKVAEPIQVKGMLQPPSTFDKQTGLIECPWTESITLKIPSQKEWVSGVYLARFTSKKHQWGTYALFVVRDDNRKADFLFQRSLSTDLAYNSWGGVSLYGGRFDIRAGRAYKVSLHRPMFNWGAGKFLPEFERPSTSPIQRGWEYSMVRWMEKEGYDVAYATNIDLHEYPKLLNRYKAFLSVGHDEYWSHEMRAHVENALERGVHLGFFSANSVYWQVRMELSPMTQEPNRVMVCYKDKDLDPIQNQFTTTVWRDPFLDKPEEKLIGVMFDNVPPSSDMLIEDTSHWIFRSTGLKNGDRIRGIMGYEVDRIMGNSPKRLKRLAHSPFALKAELYGTKHYADTTLYHADSGAYVFASGTIKWGFGLDDFGVPFWRESFLSLPLMQITRNVLSKFEKSPVPPVDPRHSDPLVDLKFDRHISQGHVFDSSARKNHGYSYGEALPTYSRFEDGGKLGFNGLGQSFNLPREASVLGKSPFAVFIKFRTDEQRRQVLISQRDDDSFPGKGWDFSPAFWGWDGEYQLEVTETGHLGYWDFDLKQKYGLRFQSKRMVTDGVWHSAEFRRLVDGTGELWLDGVLENSQRAPMTLLKSHTLFVGVDGLDRTLYFNGEISNLRIHLLE